MVWTGLVRLLLLIVEPRLPIIAMVRPIKQNWRAVSYCSRRIDDGPGATFDQTTAPHRSRSRGRGTDFRESKPIFGALARHNLLENGHRRARHRLAARAVEALGRAPISACTFASSCWPCAGRGRCPRCRATRVMPTPRRRRHSRHGGWLEAEVLEWAIENSKPAASYWPLANNEPNKARSHPRPPLRRRPAPDARPTDPLRGCGRGAFDRAIHHLWYVGCSSTFR